jgi:aspartate kinase
MFVHHFIIVFLDGHSMQVLVQKYGGTSVGTLERIAGVAQHIKDSQTQTHHKLVIVVSAMGSFTDELVAMGKGLHPSPPKREFDMLLSAGERISAALLSISLDRIGVSSVSLTGSQSGILTDEVHGNARITKILNKRIHEELAKYDVVIIAGFQGVSPLTKDVTTLGRGGSDLTAVALAISLEATGCEIYTDVPGVMTADPRQVAQAQLIKTLPWDIMGELATAGAGVVHHRAALVAQKFKMPFEIRSSQNPNIVGTKVEGYIMETPHVIAVTSKSNQTLIRYSVSSEKTVSKLLSDGLQWLWKHEQSPSVFRSYHNGTFGIEAVIDSSLVESFLEFQTSVAAAQGISLGSPMHLRNLSMITVVGVGFRHAPEIVQKTLTVFDSMPKIFEVKDHFILISVASDEETEYVNKLHNTFFH